MIDIHCHILPGVDDGSGNFNDSIEMAKLAVASGVHSIVATPHLNTFDDESSYWFLEIENLLNKLQKEIKERGIPVSIFPGQEILLTSSSLGDIKKGKFISLNHSRYCLVEFTHYEKVSVAIRKLQKIISEGYIPIIAHPERYDFVREQGDAIYRMKETGCLIQVNKGSLKGHFGRETRECAFDILRNRDADFVASDGHSQYNRTPCLSDAYEIICDHFSSDYADFLLNDNPQRLLNDEKIYIF